MFTQIKNTLYITDEKAFISYENDNVVISSGNKKKKIPNTGQKVIDNNIINRGLFYAGIARKNF